MVGRIVLNRSSMKSTNKMPSPSRFSICSFFSYSCFNPSKNSVAFLLFPLAGQLRANGFLLPFPIFIVTDYSVINAVPLVKVSLNHRILLPPEHPNAKPFGYVTIDFPSVQVVSLIFTKIFDYTNFRNQVFPPKPDRFDFADAQEFISRCFSNPAQHFLQLFRADYVRIFRKHCKAASRMAKSGT